MYSFLYYYLFVLGTKRKNSIAEFNAALFVCLAQVGHFLLVTEVIIIITGLKYPFILTTIQLIDYLIILFLLSGCI